MRAGSNVRAFAVHFDVGDSMKTVCICLVLAASVMAAQQLPSNDSLNGPLNKPDSTGVQAGTAAKKSFTLRGIVEGVDAKAGRLTVNHEKVEGWMGAMTIAYAVDKPEELEKLKPGDRIEATVYQDEYKLYNIKVTGQK